ncbi:MAG TPA: hypothetical protein VMR21_08365 [Vicinamibacteria bacterium]|nr:hypothetical protein [Vicinamibacteria bacterium]
MRFRPSLILVAVLAARSGAPETEVRVRADRVDVRASAATISEVLDRLGRQTGMKVVYDGAPPRARVSLSLSGLTQVQAVLSILEGQGLNYALRMDRTATRIEELLLVVGTGATAPPPPPPRPERPRLFQRQAEPPEPEEEEAPVEAQEADEEVRPPVLPGIPPPGGPAMPLTLPTPAPPVPSPVPATPANPQEARPETLRFNRPDSR